MKVTITQAEADAGLAVFTVPAEDVGIARRGDR